MGFDKKVCIWWCTFVLLVCIFARLPIVPIVVAGWYLSSLIYARLHECDDITTGDQRRKKKGDLTPAQDVPSDVTRTQQYVCSKNNGGLRFTQKWAPSQLDKVKGVVFMCNGYSDSSSWMPSITATKLAQSGYAVHSLDYEGHGKSDGILAFIPNFDSLIQDCYDHFSQVKNYYTDQQPSLKFFVWGESMGGAVALLLSKRHPDLVSGVILASPMCKIADDVKPPAAAIATLRAIAKVFPQAPITPSASVLHLCFKDPSYYELAIANPLRYSQKHRLATAVELERVATFLEHNLHTIEIPFLILHGSDDRVTSHEASKELHAKAASTDKTIKIFQGAWHNILNGESEKIQIQCLKEITTWLAKRS
mmetsp:Transcript_28892/g.56716  ORF Transcript_28892/g.56716 Transcript_28892/m.56716 type:complete len:365 (+) Transcript_28892:15-1109(+)